MGEERRRMLRDLMDEMDKESAELERRIEEAIKPSLSSRQFLREPFVAGLAMKVGSDGRPTIQYFGDRYRDEEGVRTPIFEQWLDEQKVALTVTVELPGVAKGDIDIGAIDGKVEVKAGTTGRKYELDIPLKKDVDPESGKATYENGILRVVFALREKTNKGYRRVRIV
jgi:HSP20 family protein